MLFWCVEPFLLLSMILLVMKFLQIEMQDHSMYIDIYNESVAIIIARMRMTMLFLRWSDYKVGAEINIDYVLGPLRSIMRIIQRIERFPLITIRLLTLV